MTAAPEKIIQFEFGPGNLVMALTSEGRLFQRTPDPKSFAQSPNHVPAYLWMEVKGPLSAE